MTKKKPLVSASAQRSRKKRAGYAVQAQVKRKWTDEETASLRLHLELFGRHWELISSSMQRSPGSLQKHAERAFGLAWLRDQVRW